jgi:hypothetical protein
MPDYVEYRKCGLASLTNFKTHPISCISFLSILTISRTYDA